MHRNHRIKKRPKSDWVTIENLSKAKTRKKHLISLKNKDPDDVSYFLQKMKKAIRIPKSRQIGSSLNMRWNPLADDEDIWIPSRGSDHHLTPRQKTRARRKQRRRNK